MQRNNQTNILDEILTCRHKGSCGKSRHVNVKISSVPRDSAAIAPHKGLTP